MPGTGVSVIECFILILRGRLVLTGELEIFLGLAEWRVFGSDEYQSCQINGAGKYETNDQMFDTG
jgi:hypothetical protein